MSSLPGLTSFDMSQFDMTKPYHAHLVSIIKKQPFHPSGNGEILKYATSGDLDRVKECLRQGSNINEVGDFGRTNALLMAIHKKNNDIVRYLLDQGADFLYVNNPPYCDTALHWAAYYKNPEACKMLLEKGALGDVKNFSGVSPLDDASNHCKECQILIREYLEFSIASRKRIEKYRETLLNNSLVDVALLMVDNHTL